MRQSSSTSLATVEVIHAGLERSSRDVEERRLWTLTYDRARTLNDKKT
jgi:hypothetical protein